MTKQISSLGSSRFPRLSRTPRSTRSPRRRNLCGKQSLIKTDHLWLTTYQFLLIYVRFLCRILFDQSQTFSLRRKLSLFLKGSDLSRSIIFSQSLKPKAKSCVNLFTDLTCNVLFYPCDTSEKVLLFSQYCWRKALHYRLGSFSLSLVLNTLVSL